MAHSIVVQSPPITYSQYVRQMQCGQKNQYSGPLPASNAAIALSWVDPVLAGMVAYLCPHCDYYHIGHPGVKHGTSVHN